MHLLAKYVLAEQEYLNVTGKLQQAIQSGDAKTAERWVRIQDALVKQTITLEGELGLTPNSRKRRGIQP